MVKKEELLRKVCVACEGKDIKPLDKSGAEEYMSQVPGWVLNSEANEISKEYKFQDFIGAINFVTDVAEIAESEGHHPNIHIHYSKVLLELSTHAIGGLSENDFIVAAKVDALKK